MCTYTETAYRTDSDSKDYPLVQSGFLSLISTKEVELTVGHTSGIIETLMGVIEVPSRRRQQQHQSGGGNDPALDADTVFRIVFDTVSISCVEGADLVLPPSRRIYVLRKDNRLDVHYMIGSNHQDEGDTEHMNTQLQVTLTRPSSHGPPSTP